MTAVNRERLLRTFQTLVSIDSPSYGERRMGDHLKQQLASLGISPEEDGAGAAIGGNCGNIYAFLPGDESLPPLLFCTHMDTVEPGAGKRAVMGEDGVIRSGGDTVLGADDCAGTAAILEALRVIREQALRHRPIEILFTAAEEAYSKGTAKLDFSKIRSREAYILDLTGPVGSAAYQAPSILSLTVSVRGRSSHAGFAPQDGVHAIQAAADAVARLPMGKIDGETTCNIGVIRGGRATNIVPDRCELQGEIRSYSHERALELSENVRRHFEDAAHSFGAEVDFALQTNCEAYRTPLEHPVVRRLQKVCGERQLPCSLVRTFGGSDNNVLATQGIAGIVLASAMHNCHSCEEFTTAEELIRLAELTLSLMTDRT
jgi:tripeptide aminopeptidase